MVYIYSKDSKVKNDMKLRSKSQTLKNLELRNAKVPKLKIFKCSSFIKNQNEVVNKIKSFFGKKKLLYVHHLIMKTQKRLQTLGDIRAS